MTGKKPLESHVARHASPGERRHEQADGTQERHGLTDAVLTISSDLELSHVLRRTVETAVRLVDAECGALGVVGDGQSLAEFVSVGLTRNEYDKIESLPIEQGLLGELVGHLRTLRLDESALHSFSGNSLRDHSSVHSFLGLPIRVRNRVFGSLYLADKRGHRDFSESDEIRASKLARAAGLAIENARVYEQSRNQSSWLEANAKIIAELLAGAEEASVLAMMLDCARHILDADLGGIALPVNNADDLYVVHASGLGAAKHRGLVIPRDGSFVGTALGECTPVTSPDVDHDPRITAGPIRWSGLGPAVAVSMGAGVSGRGVIFLARAANRAGFTMAETEPLMAFAGQATLAMELAERRRGAEQIALLEDRDRIARDLHDLAIQRLFATGMTVQSALRFVDHAEASERLVRAVNDLDETIKTIRSTIFGLRSSDAMRKNGLRERTTTVVEQAASTLGFRPSLRMEGLVDTDVDARVADDVVAVLNEALTNVARHARASSADVSLVVRAGTLTLQVKDNGIGFRGARRSSGLRNLAERAQRLQGEMTVGSGAGHGTYLRWRVRVRQ